MKKTSNPLLFFGTEQFSAASLEKLIDDNYDIRAVITKPDSKKGRGHKVIESPVKIMAKKHAIPVWQPNKVTEIADDIKKIPHVTGVLVSYGKIIPKSILDLFAVGIINIHPSLLPKYRGPSPIESAIFNGDDSTGVSIMKLTPEMDAGPVYCQKKISLGGNETRPSLYELLAKNSAALLVENLPAILDGSLTATPQDEEKATYCQLLQKSEGRLNPEEMTATECERHIRAFLGFPRSKLTINGYDCIITAASIVESAQMNPLVINCKNNTFLSIERLTAPSGKSVDAASFLRGYSA